MKKRERRENRILFGRIEQDVELFDIAENIAMAENNSFGFARASAGEKQNCFFMTALLRNLAKARATTALDKILTSSTRTRICFFIGGIISSSFKTCSGQGKSLIRSMNGVAEMAMRILARSMQDSIGRASDREVQIDWNFARERDGQVRHHRAFTRGQNDRNPLVGNFFLRNLLKAAAAPSNFARRNSL